MMTSSSSDMSDMIAGLSVHLESTMTRPVYDATRPEAQRHLTSEKNNSTMQSVHLECQQCLEFLIKYLIVGLGAGNREDSFCNMTLIEAAEQEAAEWCHVTKMYMLNDVC